MSAGANRGYMARKRKSHSLLIIGAVIVLLAVASAVVLVGLPKSATVRIQDNAPWLFPATLSVQPGTTVTWELHSPAIHPVMALDAPEEIHSGHFTNTWSYTFSEPGVYVYICPIHPYMKGIIAVGQDVPEGQIPAWVKQWPPVKQAPPGGLPAEPGVGEIWIATQFQEVPGKPKPGTITVVDAATWNVEKTIDDSRLNNPHNLWEVNGKILATNWFDRYVSVFSKDGTLEQHIEVGESPAHIMSMPDGEKIYVTLQGDGGFAILDKDFNVIKKPRAPKGPHGHWMSKTGLMALASTEQGSLSVWDTATDTMLFQAPVGDVENDIHSGETMGTADMMGVLDLHKGTISFHEEDASTGHLHSLPLMAGITADGKYAFIATSNEGKFYVFDVEQQTLVKSFEIGAGPIQAGISPDQKYVLVPLSGEAAVAVVSTVDWSLVRKLPAGAGAHGIWFGKKQSGGWYAYVTSKFATWLTVIDMDTLGTAGCVPLPSDAWGGQGVLVVE